MNLKGEYPPSKTQGKGPKQNQYKKNLGEPMNFVDHITRRSNMQSTDKVPA